MLTTSLIFLLSVATGLSVATIYLLQPLLLTVANSIGASSDQVGLIVTMTQCGYGLGILLLIPLGDVLPKKKLILSKLALLIGALCFTGFAQSYPMILFGSLCIGIFATTAQDIVPLAADLSSERSRGEVVGKVMSGLLLGILLSRTLSGFIADAFGWRAVFWIFAILVAVIGIFIQVGVEPRPAQSKIRYSELLGSTLRNFKTYPDLRFAILTQSLIGIAFSAFWTNLSFYLGAAPFEMSPSRIGLFGLAGAVGALAAPIAGKLSDRKGPHLGIQVGALFVLGSFVAMRLFPMSVPVLILGALGFDLGAQMALVSHQSLIYALNPAARSRLNALFVSAMFGAFSLGSYGSVKLFSAFGWSGVLGLCIAASGLSVFLASSRRRSISV